MAKKKKKYFIKLNNKIRNYFNGLPFEEGVATLDEDKLIELVMLVELRLPSHTKEEMIRALRRVWSEGDAVSREKIVSYLTQRYKAVPYSGSQKRPSDKVEKILQLLGDTTYTKYEENLILEAFIDAKNSKLTEEKVRNKLTYLRMRGRLHTLENSLEVVFNSLNEMEFYHSFTFALHSFDFNKLLLCTTPTLNMDELWNLNDEEIITKLEDLKEETIKKKTAEIEAFLKHVQDSKHPYLTEQEINTSLKSMSPETLLYHAPIAFETVEKILMEISDKYDVFESTDHIIIEKEKNDDLFGTTLFYNTSVSYEKPYIYNLIWRGKELPVKDDINRVNDDLLAHFRVAIDDVMEEMREESDKLDIEEEKLHEFIVRFVEPQIRSSNVLKFKEKSKRRILFHFGEYIRPLLEKQNVKSCWPKPSETLKTSSLLHVNLKERSSSM